MPSPMSRPKGFYDWSPSPEWATRVNQVNAVLDEYASYGALTVRQVFYRLVGKYEYDKTERAYQTLVGKIVLARRAQLIHFDRIRDDSGRSQGGPHGYTSVESFLNYLDNEAAGYYRDTFQQQPAHIVVFCEAAGLVPMVANILKPYRIEVTGTGGFASVTVTHRLGLQASRRRMPTHFLHIGDHDPSGVAIFESMSQDVGKFCAEYLGAEFDPETGETFHTDGNDGPDFRPLRVALHKEQVEEYGLATAPAKSTDSRSRKWVGETTQLEALAPDDLAALLKAAVEPLIDWPRVKAWERLQYAENAFINPTLPRYLQRARTKLLEATDTLAHPDFDEDPDDYAP